MLTADQGSYFVRLGDLAPSFRQRAFEHALSHLQHRQFQARAALAQLDDAFRLVRALPSPLPHPPAATRQASTEPLGGFSAADGPHAGPFSELKPGQRQPPVADADGEGPPALRVPRSPRSWVLDV